MANVTRAIASPLGARKIYLPLRAPKPAKAKSKPMSEPEGVTAPKAGGRQDVLSPRTASKKAEKQIKEAAFWQEAYEHTLRAEHGIARGFAPLSKPIPEDLLTITNMKEQKWTAMVYWSDVLDKNFIGHVKAVPEDALTGKRARRVVLGAGRLRGWGNVPLRLSRRWLSSPSVGSLSLQP